MLNRILFFDQREKKEKMPSIRVVPLGAGQVRVELVLLIFKFTHFWSTEINQYFSPLLFFEDILFSRTSSYGIYTVDV